MNIEDFITASEAGEILNVNRARIGVLCRQGRFEGAKKIKLGWLIPRKAVLNFTRLPPGLKPRKNKNEQDKELIENVLKKMKESEKND